MPKPTLELRERVLRACGCGSSRSYVAEQFNISRTTLAQWLRLTTVTGDVEPRPHGGGMLRKVEESVLESVLAELSDGTRAEYIKLADTRVGLLLNFGAERIKDGITRHVHRFPE